MRTGISDAEMYDAARTAAKAFVRSQLPATMRAAYLRIRTEQRKAVERALSEYRKGVRNNKEKSEEALQGKAGDALRRMLEEHGRTEEGVFLAGIDSIR